MKTLLFALLSVVVLKASAQSVISVQPATTVINPKIQSGTTPQMVIDTVHVTVILSGNVPVANQTVTFSLAAITATNNPSLTNTVFVITPTEWTNAVNNNNALISFTLNLSSTAFTGAPSSYQVATISASTDNNIAHVQTVIYSTSGQYTQKPFWVEMGSNFDLLNNFKANNLYAGIFMHKKDISDKHVTLFGGIYESESAGSSISSDSGIVYRDGKSYIKDADKGYPVFRDTGNVSLNTLVKSLGLFISPQYRITKKSANLNGLHVFGAAWIEMLWQRTKETYDYSKTGRLATPATYLSTTDSLNIFQAKTVDVRSSDYRSQYFGVGLPLFLKEENAFFYLNPVIGFTNQRFALSANTEDMTMTDANKKLSPDNLSGTFTPSKRWNPFFLMMFRLSEEKYGLSVTGEVRGLILKNVKPTISLAVSKKFDLQKLIEFL